MRKELGGDGMMYVNVTTSAVFDGLLVVVGALVLHEL
jgi:hypothetical protein